MPPHKAIFTVAMTCISRAFALRERLLGRVDKSIHGQQCGPSTSQHIIPSGRSTLDAAYVAPGDGPPRASLLICHGIGEVVDQWFPVQRLLAQSGVATLVFDYSGYGRSVGRVDYDQFSDDAVAAFDQLQRLTPGLPIAVLGISMGSGIAADMIHRVPADRLILCTAFTTFQEGARSIGLPRWLMRLVPPIWRSTEILRRCTLPLLVVHCENDQLFPAHMARELIASSAGSAELAIVPNHRHSDPFHHPHLAFWGHVIAFTCKRG
jgi:hypothetical protein